MVTIVPVAPLLRIPCRGGAKNQKTLYTERVDAQLWHFPARQIRIPCEATLHVSRQL